jgi:predicted ATPase/class 3 adenylate cyclase
MATLPTGTVTFLFTDIEGSTRLLQELGDAYRVLRDDHAAILRRAIADGEGIEVSTGGDSFFAVFAAPAGAVRAVVAAQRDLAAHEWPEGSAVRVRMGLHTGEGQLGGEDYIGIDVHRAARVADAAHGGQVILSDVTRALVERSLPERTTLRDLGPHRLKDIVAPEHLFDLAIEGLPSDFPPPRSLDARPNNLPAQLTSFVGREQEIAEITRLLERSRILTLTGPGGTGKTRLALQVAAEEMANFADGVFLVELASVSDPALVSSAVAGALGIRDQGGEPILDLLTSHLRSRELLLVVDNFEQVADAGPLLEELTQAAPGLKILVTSRVVLSIRGEQEYGVPPLEPPDPEQLPDLATLRGFEAVRLFAERAEAVRPGFEVTPDNAMAVAGITARLDGLPLAIELAATRTKVLTPQQMLERLVSRLALLTSGTRTVPDRQRTLRDAIAWSYDLLEEPERRLFARLSIFSGGWTLESAEAVCEPGAIGLDTVDALTSLVDKSLIRASDLPGGDRRFSMLETIREFGQEQLEDWRDLDAMLERHGEHFLVLAVEAEPHLVAQDQAEWLDRCEVEHPNLRSALRWAIETGRADRAQEAAGAVWRFWQQRGHLTEGRRWLDEILAMPGADRPSPGRVKALIGAGGVAWWQQDRARAGECYEQAVAVERELGDPGRIAEALYNLAFVVAGEDVDAAAKVLEESLELFRQAGDERGQAEVMTMLVIRDAQAGEWDQVRLGLEAAVEIWRRLGERLHLAFDLVWLGFAYGRLGRRQEARSTALEALDLFREADNRTGMGIAFSDLAFLATWEGRHEDAIRLAGAAETVKERVGGPPGGFAGILDGDPVAEAGAHLPHEVVTRAWDQGLAMTLDEAVALARGLDTDAEA